MSASGTSEGCGIEGFAELTLQAREPAALEGFYVDVVGLERLAGRDDRIWLKVGRRSRLGLWTPGEKEFGDHGGAHVHFAFSVRPGSLAELRARLQSAGITADEVEHDGGDRSLYFTDPEGNRVEAWDFFTRGENRAEGVEALR